MRVTRQTLGSQDFAENHQKTLFESFSNANKKQSKNHKKTLRRPWKFWKTLKKTSRGPLKPSKNPPGDIFEGFGQGKLTEGGARASARAPLWWILKAKTHKHVSGEGFLMVLGGRGMVFWRFFKISGGGGRFFYGFLMIFLLALEKLSKSVFWWFSGKSWDPRIWRVIGIITVNISGRKSFRPEIFLVRTSSGQKYFWPEKPFRSPRKFEDR